MWLQQGVSEGRPPGSLRPKGPPSVPLQASLRFSWPECHFSQEIAELCKTSSLFLQIFCKGQPYCFGLWLIWPLTFPGAFLRVRYRGYLVREGKFLCLHSHPDQLLLIPQTSEGTHENIEDLTVVSVIWGVTCNTEKVFGQGWVTSEISLDIFPLSVNGWMGKVVLNKLYQQ